LVRRGRLNDVEQAQHEDAARQRHEDAGGWHNGNAGAATHLKYNVSHQTGNCSAGSRNDIERNGIV